MKKTTNNGTFTDLIGLLGVGVVSYGISLINYSAAYIFAGSCFIILSILASRGEN